MKSITHYLLLLALTTLVPGGSRPAIAQPPAEEAKPALPPGVRGDDDPLIAAILASKPTTPEHLLETIDTLVKFQRGDLAKKYVQQLSSQNLTDDAWGELGEEVGPALLLRLSTAEELGPEGMQLMTRAIDATRTWLARPERLELLLTQLKNPNEAVRTAAIAQLDRAGVAAIEPLLKLLAADAAASRADPQHRDESLGAQEALVHLGAYVDRPLEAVLATANDELRLRVIRVLGLRRAGESIPFILAAAYSPDASPRLKRTAETALGRLTDEKTNRRRTELLLYQLAMNYLRGRAKLREELAGSSLASDVVLWQWDDNSEQLTSETVPANLARAIAAGQLTQSLHAMMPDSAKVRDLFIAVELQQTKLVAGLNQPLPADSPLRASLSKLGVAAVESALQFTMDENFIPAAIGAVELLSTAGKVDLLYNQSADNPSSIVRALRNPNRRLRMAAATAIVGWNPTKPFVGAGQTAEVLKYFASSDGVPQALVAGLHPAQRQQMANLLTALGYDVEVCDTPQSCLKKAARSPDFELAVISYGLDQRSGSTLVQHLRGDYRTALMPIIVTAMPKSFPFASAHYRKDRRTVVAHQPIAKLDLMRQVVETAIARAGSTFQSRPLRVAQAKQALQFLGQIAANLDSPFYSSGMESAASRALLSSELNGPAAALLAELPSAGVQRQLVAVASRSTEPLAVRQATAAAFAASVKRFGNLLTRREIRHQYDRYNASAEFDRDTQQIFGQILDAIETGHARNEKGRNEKRRNEKGRIEKDAATPASK